MTRPLLRTALLLATLLLMPKLARADDLADQAELEFSLGADSYQRADYKVALEHFLISNRLVANKNVLFNIARSYEQLKSYPAAFRYYSLALESETDHDARAKINTALAQIKRYVMVLRITTRPAGATLYIDRKDLGARGASPQLLGLAPRAYQVIAEFPGYEPAVVDVPATPPGQELALDLQLTPILGEVSFSAEGGTRVNVDGEPDSTACIVPCERFLSEGSHIATFSHSGFHASQQTFTVRAHEHQQVSARLEPLMGSALISTDEPGALIEIDGRASGFTPTIISLPVGMHRVRLELKGFRPEDRQIGVALNGQTRLDVVLAESEEVVAASRAREQIEDAPSSVTLVGERELAAFASPTIAEAVRGVPGIYLSDDRSYVTLGMRGLGRLGSYGNRLLVTYDGQAMNDNWIGSSYVGYDGLTDLGDVQRIEVVRGPGSVLYGTNALSGVINVVSQNDAKPGVSAGISSNQSGVARARVRGDVKLGKDAGAWASVAIGRGNGREFYFPEFVGSPAAPDGVARNVDGFEAGTLRGRAYWKFISLQWSAHSYEKNLPTAEFDTLFGDPRTKQTDRRSYVELRAEPRVSDAVTVLSRLHWNHYTFRGQYAHDESAGGLEVDTYRGSWLGLEERLEFTPFSRLKVTLGGEGQLHYQVEQHGSNEEGTFLDDTGSHGRPFQVGALYALADASLSAKAQLSVGVRLDAYSTFGSSLNPRAALILKPYAAGNTKVIVGKAFRAPSIYELYYNDGGYTQVQSPHLSPESLYSLEVEHAHRFSANWVATATAYANYAAHLISSVGASTQEDPLHYENERSPLLVVGGEFGLRREFRQGAMFSISYGVSLPRFLETNSAGDLLSLSKALDKRSVANAPIQLASLKGVIPILNRALNFGTRMSVEGPRFDRYENTSDTEEQGTTGGAVIVDLVFSGEEPRYGLRYAFGVYNALDFRYSVPVSSEFVQRNVQQDGRSFLASLEAKF
ncbi:MAG TPA: TonB-dependent receptor [Polyangiaceae bacterium]|nr:TonB-dependent receptor [Polyangiaceae bacterium]